MRAILSFVRASVIGLATFAVMTASLCIALSIAIAGPPTAEEMASVRLLFAHVSRAIDAGALRLGEDICSSPNLSALCPGEESEPVAVAEAAPPTLAPTVSRADEAIIIDAPPSAEDAPLLGGLGVTDPPPPPPRAEPPRPPRTETARAPRPRIERRSASRDARRPASRVSTIRRAPPPLRHTPQERAETLPAASEGEVLREIRSAPATELRHAEPTQEQQPVQTSADWDEPGYEEDPYYEDRSYDPGSPTEDEYYLERDPYESW